MPRPKKPGVEPKRRSRNGCWPCKARKVKCGEEKPQCTNCERQGETCDYSIRLNWGGRTKREKSGAGSDVSSTASGSPYQATFSFEEDGPPLFPPTPGPSSRPSHVRSRSNISPPRSNTVMVDPAILGMGYSKTPPMMNFRSYDYVPSNSGQPTSTPYSQTKFQNTFEFQPVSNASPEPFSHHHMGFNAINAITADAPLSPPSMLPPQASLELAQKQQSQHHSFSSPATTMSDAHSPYTGPLDPFSPYMAMPLTPNSSVGSDEPVSRTISKHDSPSNPPPDLRRMSVQSIINNDFSEHSEETAGGRQYPIADFSAITYGYDLGLPDLDTPNNDDFAAIAIFSPQADTMELDGETPYGSADPRSNDMAFEGWGYYAKPVAIQISKSLGALPPILMENRMNLLYFHHFLNHTARILVPHDCERNPFRQILPQMAVNDDSIMNLLLAYSAAHRARMLHHPEPSNRIALWVQNVFPKLRHTLLLNPAHISDATLAAVIMMASLEIISSGTFEVPVSWQNHLTMARQMIVARGGPRGMGREDCVAYFLSRWFAYLDVLGSLSGNKNDMPLGSAYWSNVNAVADEDFEIDCLMGFTTRCVGSLARISELAKCCEAQRIDEQGNVRADWIPEPDVVQKAVQIRRELEEGLLERNIRKGCNHRSSASTESEGAWDATEIYATNEMFHWAGLIHLYRRVLGKPGPDIEVQNAVREILGLLYKIRRGSTAEACLIFPMFAAGCDTEDQGQREKIMERLKSVEGFGMTHTPRVATLLQRVWDTGKPWESLVSGEFFG
ncbi:hypothetical protein CC86DRAFT_313167 [Ophiobolus disseminans]|uniref:Zn(2)-C6 fungal-type domain-containing protein n=1 Tax=Ophiobolus disseminans TaxID=1469910 RepID=A0A6A7AG92_9PLEO|nr:hypothetical protein CC86DRAFT_313167 [Ophiobolus disseminans]